MNHYLATTVNDAGKRFLHLTAGRCVNIRFTDHLRKTLDSRGYCNFKDHDGDTVYIEYTAGTPKPRPGRIIAGTGKYDGIPGSFDATNSNNLDDSKIAHQAAGKMMGRYQILRDTAGQELGVHD